MCPKSRIENLIYHILRDSYRIKTGVISDFPDDIIDKLSAEIYFLLILSHSEKEIVRFSELGDELIFVLIQLIRRIPMRS
jgi:hypothetical protein